MHKQNLGAQFRFVNHELSKALKNINISNSSKMQIYYLTLNIQVGYLFTLQITFTSHLNSASVFLPEKQRQQEFHITNFTEYFLRL